jgi:putative oxidoreductase
MERWPGNISEVLYSFMRIIIGFLFACHGAMKLFGVLGAQSRVTDSLMVTAGVIEFAGGILVAIGLFAGYAAFISSGQMAVAYFKMHAPQGFWPIENNGELAVIYCFTFLFIASKGAGRLSVSALLRRRHRLAR